MRGSEREIEFRVTMGKYTLALGPIIVNFKIYIFVAARKNVDS